MFPTFSARRLWLPLTGLALTACAPDSAVRPVDSEYPEVVRRGYFEVAREQDWRTAFIGREQALGDLAVLDSLVEGHYAYDTADDVDAAGVLSAIAEALPERIRRGDFAMQLQKALALSIDGHAPRIAGRTVAGVRERIEDRPPGDWFVPFELRSTGSRIVAYDGETRTLIDPDHPYVASIDGRPVEEWIDAAQSIVVAGSPQLRWHRGSWHLGNLGFLRFELGLRQTDRARFEFVSEGGRTVERTVELVRESVARRERYPLAVDAGRGVPEDIAYVRIRRMESDADFLEELMQWVEESRDARGAVIDIRDNGGGSRLPLLTLLPHVLDPEGPPAIVTAGKLMLAPECRRGACEEPPGGYLADRFMTTRDGFPLGSPERVALDDWLPGFRPEWTPPESAFTDWHYLVIAPNAAPALHGKPVVVLMNHGNFSASDIFLSGFAGRPNVTLIGTPSSGGSARRREHVLPASDLVVSLATLASFQARSSELYDGVGIQPDIYMESEPGFFVGRSDAALDRAVEWIREAAEAR